MGDQKTYHIQLRRSGVQVVQSFKTEGQIHIFFSVRGFIWMPKGQLNAKCKKVKYHPISY